ncbi:hypothetical protein BH24ACT5_BH24ACT5_08630 [soil metagenome]
MERRFDAQTESLAEGVGTKSDRGAAISGRHVVHRTGTLTESMRAAGPATSDDVTILCDGRRLDTREKVLAFVREFEAEYPHLCHDPTAIDHSR